MKRAINEVESLRRENEDLREEILELKERLNEKEDESFEKNNQKFFQVARSQKQQEDKNVFYPDFESRKEKGIKLFLCTLLNNFNMI